MGGVPRLATSLANAIESALGEDKLIIATTGMEPPPPLQRGDKGGYSQATPNKLVAFLTYTGLSSFDRLFAEQNADVLFLPNLNLLDDHVFRTPFSFMIFLF
jgi:hypothetical protein